MSTVRVAIVRGGPGGGFEASLRNGSYLLSQLPEGFEGFDIFVDKEGIWHEGGVPVSPERALRHADVVLNALHPDSVEAVDAYRALESFSVPYTGTRPLSASLATHPLRSRELLRKNGLRAPHSMEVKKGKKAAHEIALELFRSFPMPSIVRAGKELWLAKDFHSLERALGEAFKDHETVLIEEHIAGKRAAVAVADEFRGKKHYAFFPMEVAFDGTSERLLYPGTFSQEEKSMLGLAAHTAHQALGLRHYSRADFVVHPKRGVYLLSVNPFPSFADDGLFSDSLGLVGSNVPDFLKHVMSLARDKKER